MSTHNLCFKLKCEKYKNFLSENFHFSVVKFSVYLSKWVFVMNRGHIGSQKTRCSVLPRHFMGAYKCFIF